MNANKLKLHLRSRQRILKGAFWVFWGMVIGFSFLYHKEIIKYVKDTASTVGGGSVQVIEVAGVRYTEPSELKAALAIEKGDALVPYNVSEARVRLEALPWVKLATVEKRLPDRLVVNLYEYNPVARVDEDGQWFVVSKDAVRILEDKENQFVSLPALTGVGAAEAAAELLVQLQTKPNIVAQLKTANYVGERRWDFTFKSGVLVRFPEGDLAESFNLLKELEDARHVLSLVGGVVDLRIADKVILKIPPELNETPVL